MILPAIPAAATAIQPSCHRRQLRQNGSLQRSELSGTLCIMLKDIFPHAIPASVGPPAAEAAVAATEASLGVRFPDQLRRLYLECNGFRENKGNAEYLFRLNEGDSLLQTTHFLWTEIDVPDLKPFIF